MGGIGKTQEVPTAVTTAGAQRLAPVATSKYSPAIRAPAMVQNPVTARPVETLPLVPVMRIEGGLALEMHSFFILAALLEVGWNLDRFDSDRSAERSSLVHIYAKRALEIDNGAGVLFEAVHFQE